MLPDRPVVTQVLHDKEITYKRTVIYSSAEIANISKFASFTPRHSIFNLE